MSEDDPAPGNVTPLPGAQQLPEEPPPTPLRGLHGFATTSMAVLGALGIFLGIALLTVNWTPWSRHVVIVILVLTMVAFLASAFIAVFAGARATHPRHAKGSSTE